MARPEKIGSKLLRRIAFRISEADYDQYLNKVRDSGQDASEYFRTCVMGNQTTVVARSLPSTDTVRLIYHFNKIGNNLNQLTKRLHEDHLKGLINDERYEFLLKRLDAIATYLKEKVPPC